MKYLSRTIFFFAFIFSCLADLKIGSSPNWFSFQSAQAVVGRPLTPVSYAGVARRTTRRAVGYSAVGATAVATTAVVGAATIGAATMTSLPSECVNSVVNGITYSNCNGVYYQPSYSGTDVVYVKVNPS
ncbi:MAG TPA: hypothetical protein VM432_01120 [Bdellovibrionales bacterium]|jgi:hypothetical protein|nr:hypothetical protein [Bdellovibrionales bacterium]